MSLLTDPRAILLIIVSLTLLSIPIIPQQYTVIEYTQESFTYEQPSPTTLVDRNFLFIHWREAHQSIKNTDSQEGKFSLNFIFDNGIEKKTSTESVDLLPGEQKEVTTKVPLSGQVNVEVNVLPPFKILAKEKTVEKKVSAWSIIGSWFNPFD